MKDYTERLNKLFAPIKETEQNLCATGHVAVARYEELSWQQHENGRWRIFFFKAAGDVPLLECKLEERRKALSLLEGLVAECDHEMDEFFSEEER